MSKIIDLIKNPRRILAAVLFRTASLWPDKLYLKLLYFSQMGKRLDLENPKTFNEKLQWLKLYNRKPEYTTMVDKYTVKEYVAAKIGEEYVIPTLGVWDNVEDIDWKSLPNQFVLKTTHGGGNTGVVICKDKNTIDVDDVKSKLYLSLKQDLFKSSREWPYKNIVKRIIAEPYMEDNSTRELRDYKFFCFNGEVKCMFIGSERQKREEPFFDFYDCDFNLLVIKQGHPNSVDKPSKPCCFEKMKGLASVLSEGIPHVRIDFYEVNGCVYFGEMTFFHFGAFVPFEPDSWDYIFGSWINLPLPHSK